MSDLQRRTILFGAALAPFAAPMAPLALADTEPRPTDLVINVKDYGAFGDGSRDDTVAIEAAFKASGTTGTIYFPPGNYIYNGSGLDSVHPIGIIGAAKISTRITLGDSSYFINYSGRLPGLQMRELSFSGGKGAVKHTFTGTNVGGYYIVQNCEFRGYSESAIASDSSDMPYWHIRDCFFDSANTVNTIGVALGNGSDQCIVDACSFIRNRIHIKARRGNNFHITRCDLLQFSSDNSGGPRAAVWITPAPSNTNSGSGLTITGCKFGNEGMAAGDFRILYSDEMGGSSNGTMLPNLDSDSQGFISGHNISQNAFMGSGTDLSPIIYSTTPKVRDLIVSNNVVAGALPSYVLEFKSPSRTPDRLAQSNVIGPFTGQQATEFLPFELSNASGVGYWQDPQGLQQRSNTLRNWSSGTSASFAEILSIPVNSFTTVSSSKTDIPDAHGGGEAVRLLLAEATAALTCMRTTPFAIGRPTWVEFDVSSPADSAAATQFFASISDGGSIVHWRRCIEVPPRENGWVTYAYCFSPNDSGGGSTRITFSTTGSNEVGKSINIGRTRVYQANERQLGGRRPVVDAPATDERGATVLANNLRDTLISLGLVSGQLTNEALAPPVSSIARKVPLHSNSVGTAGQIALDSSFLYVCVSPDTWNRIPLTADKW